MSPTEAKDGFSIATSSPSQVSEDQVKKKSTDAKGELSTGVASPSQVSDGQMKKKSTDSKNELSANVATFFLVADGKGKKESTNVKNEPSNGVVSPSQVSNGRRKKKSTDVTKLFSADVTSSSQVSDVKRKTSSPNVDENGSAKNRSVGCIKGENHVRRRTKNSTILVRGDNLTKVTSLANDCEEIYGDFLEDDLEQNAARILASRFDPSCTGFSGSRGPLSKSENGFLGNSKALQPVFSSVESVDRMLRRRKHNGKSSVRKRRHFYEVSYMDMDPYCIIKQRIRVFWPLDKSWYFGLVKDYDPVTRLHHVKYDDSDEEWINLQNERFKLLLFPSEILGRVHSGKSWFDLEPDKESDKKAVDDSFGNCKESEPIIAWLTRSKLRRRLSESNMIKKRRTHALKEFESSISDLHVPSGVTVSNSFPKRLETSPEAPDVKSSNILNDRELSFVYSKKFHKRTEGLDKTLEHDSVHVGSAASINILASVAASAAAWEELDLFSSSMEQKRVSLALSFQQLYIHDLACPVECSLWHALFSLQFGKLANVWPMVHMEILLVDNVLGLRSLLFEGSLGCAARLLCFIVRSFCQPSNGSKFKEVQTPFTSIGINFSGPHDHDRKLLFLMYRFFGMDSSKWRHVKYMLKNHCVTMIKVPLLKCMPSTFKNIRHESGHMFHTLIYKNVVSLENFSENSCTDVLHRIVPDKKACSNMNPTICYIDENCGRFLLYPRHFTEPSFIVSLHIRLLIEHNATSVGFQKRNSDASQESPDSNEKLIINDCSLDDHSDQVSDITIENLCTSLDRTIASYEKLSASHLNVEADAFSMRNNGVWARPYHSYLRNDVSISGNSAGCQSMVLNESDETVVQREMLPSCSGSWQDAEKSSSSFPEGYSSADKSEGGYESYMHNTKVPVVQIEPSTDKGTSPVESVLESAWEMNGYSSHCFNPRAPRSMRHCNVHSPVSPKYGQSLKFWQDDFMPRGFISGLKKPRSMVSYSLPFGGYDLGSKRRSNHRKPRSYKRIRTDDAKRHVSANSQSYHEQLICNANVLVTSGDKGWREFGAQVALGSDDQKDWRICVKLAGGTKYADKVHHIVQPGITNRYTHAMMWKGGKNWTLEFTDRSQWSLFKEIHEECYNRNMRAAYVKSIPIPGVRLIADDDYDVGGVPFIRNSSKYHRQIGTEVDMALDPAHVLYDMDSDDEECVSEMKNSEDLKGVGISEVTDNMFERIVDIFEKVSYAQQRDEFSNDEMDLFMADVGPLDIVKTIHEYWRQKRLKKGMALIRQYQTACWVRYQKQLKKWESTRGKMHYLLDGSREKACPTKKPPMFAFCLRPRGLDAPNKLSKQRSHKKLMSVGWHNAFAREQDEFHPSGRRTNGLGPSDESSDSHRSNDGADRFQYLKRATVSSPRDSQMQPSLNNRKLRSQMQQDGLRRHRADIDELKLREASNAARHASNMAKMRRERAQWLIHKADLAIHKAAAGLMIAEAMN